MKALTGAAALGDGKLSGVPFTYQLDHLAQRWGVAPWALEDDEHQDWLIRGLEFQSIEASVEVKRG